MALHRLEDQRQDAGKKTRILSMFLLVLSLLILLYPVVSTVWNDYQNNQTARRYQEEIEQVESPDQLAEIRQNAIEYNERLEAAGHPARAEKDEDPEYQDYKSQMLTTPQSSILGRVTIPDIGVDLPIYHGTKDNVLYRGAGHMYGSDLPIGGEGNTSAITAHTGMVNASMFDNLHQLKEGEAVYLSVLGEKLRYRMTGSEIVKPEDYDAVTYEEGVDKIVLITCTPYGINSDRLLVTAVRDDETPVTDDELGGWQLQLSWWMKLDLAIVALIIAIAAWSSLRAKRRQKQKEQVPMKEEALV